MNNKWKKVTDELQKLTKKYTENKTQPPSNIHEDILIRALKLLDETAPEAAELIRPQLKIMLPYTVIADNNEDRENGAGRHYYCACNTNGKPQKAISGYYKNGKDLFAKSARTMFEEDYTMALTMHQNGFVKQGAVYLARAVHMMSDMCCLPHAAKMTYFSKMRSVHIRYEDLARVMYPEFVPEQHITYSHLRRFSMRSSFSTAINNNSAAICRNAQELFVAPVDAITDRLYDTEQAVAALLYRFYRDTKVTPLRGHYIVNGMVCHPFSDMPALNIKVTEKGITFELEGVPVNSHLGSIFRAAHRRSGHFTLTPLGCTNGYVLSRSSQKLVPFDPRDEKQFFAII
ncbi:hypothetical protein [Ruminococcus sp.]|uniref:hypothetical protein n=1 Tax=Ruminococcus sp. TaxID=41978 RepID=UPI0025F5D128|nr:hypothetical protein [Ruminococcus sp.]